MQNIKQGIHIAPHISSGEENAIQPSYIYYRRKKMYIICTVLFYLLYIVSVWTFLKRPSACDMLVSILITAPIFWWLQGN